MAGVYKLANFWPAAGYIHQSNGDLGSAGSYGYYWGRRAYSNANNAYFLYFDGSVIRPSNYADRYRGYPVRCVASY